MASRYCLAPECGKVLSAEHLKFFPEAVYCSLNCAQYLELKTLKALCEQMGYGYVMQFAANEWRKKDPLGAHTVGPPESIKHDMEHGPDNCAKCRNGG